MVVPIGVDVSFSAGGTLVGVDLLGLSGRKVHRKAASVRNFLMLLFMGAVFL